MLRVSLPIDFNATPGLFLGILHAFAAAEPERHGLDGSLTDEDGKPALQYGCRPPMYKTVKGELYRLESIIAARRKCILGRGTTVFEAESEKYGRVVIKEQWRTEDRVPETNFLSRLKGAECVMQPVDGVDNVMHTREMFNDSDSGIAVSGTCIDPTSLQQQVFGSANPTDPQLQDIPRRILSTIILPHYRGNISKFASVSELLDALRCASIGAYETFPSLKPTTDMPRPPRILEARCPA